MNNKTVYEEYAAKLEHIKNRDELLELLGKVSEDSRSECREIEDSIKRIARIPKEAFRGADHEKIRTNCQILSSRLLDHPEKSLLSQEVQIVEQILADFAENCFFERFLNPRTEKCQYQIEGFREIKPKSEYDVQHLLYCILRTYFNHCRLEVSEDDGYQTVRSDIRISDETILEIKSTIRSSMKLRDLTEEIAADMVCFEKTLPTTIFLSVMNEGSSQTQNNI